MRVRTKIKYYKNFGQCIIESEDQYNIKSPLLTSRGNPPSKS
nr:MAG TPA: hypothetical protein [Caudoviricetes sp.]